MNAEPTRLEIQLHVPNGTILKLLLTVLAVSAAAERTVTPRSREEKDG